MGEMLHDAVEEPVDRFRKTKMHRAMQLLAVSRWASRRHHPAHIRRGVLHNGDEGDEEIPHQERNQKSEQECVLERCPNALTGFSKAQRHIGNADDETRQPGIDNR